PGQLGFVGGSMGDISVILQGIDSEKSRRAFYSTVHGAGRIMSRTKAAGKRRKGKRSGGAIHPDRMKKAVRDYGVELRGGGTDESPFVRSEEHTSELQSRFDLVCRLLLEKKNPRITPQASSRR